jgi:topoisomerase-4 subunit A
VKLQHCREGGLRDAKRRLDHRDGRTRSWVEWRERLGRQAGARKLAPK